MKIEALEAVKSDGYVLDAEDVKTVPDEIGAKWCAAGWAKDTTGTVATGERKVLDARITVSSGVHVNKTPELGVK